LVEIARWVAHTHDVLTQLEATATGVAKAEAELRGFLMTDQESYLVPYSAGLTKTRHRLEAVRKLTADNPCQQARVDKLERLILHRLDLLEALLKIGHDQGFGAARRILTFDQGPQYMEEIRQGIQDMEHEEQEILASRFAQQEYPRVREMFTRGSVLASDWYKERLRAKQERDIALWSRHIAALEAFVSGPGSRQFDVRSRLAEARAQMTRVSSVAYLAELVGTIGADPFTDGH
jgi:CHASE3 domain sensor protein